VLAQNTNIDGRAFAVQSQNYVLTRERPINYLLRLLPDDTHILIAGGPMAYLFSCGWARGEDHFGHEFGGGTASCRSTGWVLEGVAAARWRELCVDGQCVVAGAYGGSSEDWGGEESVKRFAESAQWATPAMLRELIGSNFEQ
jgi:uncharacterized protein